MKNQFFFLALLLIPFSFGYGQLQRVGSPSITSFSRSDYQAGTQNWATQQNEKGIVYFANNKGLLEFDGTNWRTYPLPNGTIVRSFSFGKNNRIYIGGQNELGYLAPDKKGKQTYTSLTNLIPEAYNSFEDVWKIFSQGDAIYFCSEKAIFQLSENEVKVIQPKSKRFENFFELDGKIFVQDQKEGLFLLQNNEFQIVEGGDIFSNERIVALLPFSQTQSLFITFSKGLYLMDESGIIPWKVNANNFLTTHQAYCGIQLEDGRYAIGTPQNGLIIINQAGELGLHLNESKGLQNNTVLCVAQDIQKNLWLGLDNGIDYAEVSSPFSKIMTQEGITGTGYASVIHDGKLYLGTNQGLFFTEWEKEKTTFENKTFQPVKNALGQVWNINEVNDQVIISQHKGASYLDGDKVNSFSNIQGAWKFIELKKNPNYAIQGTYSGFYLYKKISSENLNNTFTNWKLIGKVNGFDESARIFEEDGNGDIWVSHAYKGLYKIKLSNDLLSAANVKPYFGSNGLPTKLFINVEKIRNELVYTTPRGIFKYDKSNDQFVPHQDFEEIFGKDRNYHRLIEDKMGNVWFSMDNEFGVIKVEEKGVFNQFKVHYFNQLQEDLVDGFEHVYTHDAQNVFIGTEKGFVHYNPEKEKDKDFQFKTLIREVTSITQGDSIVFWGNATNEDFEFHYQMNDFRFAFSTPYYEKISYLNYRYKLEGFEDEWTDWSPKTEKEFTNLDAGKYSFKVQAKNAYGQISKEAKFDFEILPPWYWAWYSKVGYFILGLLGLYGLNKLISKKEEKKTEAFKKEQVEKLEMKEAEFKKEVEKSEGEIIKLRNEKLNTDIKHKNSQLASATMHLVQKSEILMKIKNDLTNIQSEATPDVKKKIQQITRTIESDIQLDDNWEQFETYFDQVHENFFKRLRLKHPNLTPKDQKLCAYLRMNLTTKEIAPLLNISVRGVEISRYRLRKKLGLNSEVNLVAFILEV